MHFFILFIKKVAKFKKGNAANYDNDISATTILAVNNREDLYFHNTQNKNYIADKYRFNNNSNKGYDSGNSNFDFNKI